MKLILSILSLCVFLIGKPYSLLAQSHEPYLNYLSAMSITQIEATLGVSVFSDGGASIFERGFVYSVTETNSNPILNGQGVVTVLSSGTGDYFESQVTNLVPGTEYTYRAYAKNNEGTGYSEAKEFITFSSDLEDLFLYTNLNIDNRLQIFPSFDKDTTPYTAIMLSGHNFISVYSPTVVVAETTAEIRVNGSSYAENQGQQLPVDIGLNTIDIRVTPPVGEAKIYTVELTVLEQTQPTVEVYSTAIFISQTSATLGGNVTSDGFSEITERGVLGFDTATSQEFFQVATTGTTGSFYVEVTGLTPGTEYTYGAYAINSEGITYSATATFNTLSGVEQPISVSPPTVSELVIGPVRSGSETVTTGVSPYSESIDLTLTSGVPWLEVAASGQSPSSEVTVAWHPGQTASFTLHYDMSGLPLGSYNTDLVGSPDDWGDWGVSVSIDNATPFYPRVVDEVTGEGIAGVTIEVTQPNQSTFQVTSGEDGYPDPLTTVQIDGQYEIGISGPKVPSTPSKFATVSALAAVYPVFEIPAPPTNSTGDNDGASTSWQTANGFDPEVDDLYILDSDGDGDLDIWEIFQGTDRNSGLAGEKHGLRETAATVDGTTQQLKTRMRRDPNQTAVIGTPIWSCDMVNWYFSGQSDGTNTVTISEQVVGSAGDDEIVEVTAEVTTGSCDSLFLSVEVLPNEP